MDVFGIFVDSQVAVATWDYFWVLYSAPHWSVIIPAPCCFYNCGSRV